MATTEICDLYLHSPKGSIVLCVDEKTGMQALERKHPDRPAAPNRAARREFEYKRHGTQTMIAAFNVHTGQVLASCGATRKGDDLERFMDQLASFYPNVPIHIVWDNLNIHLGERWVRFNERHGGRFQFHYTPLHASWVNQIELWFSILQRRALNNASLVSIEQLRELALTFVQTWNAQAHPFRWTFTGYPLQGGDVTSEAA